MTISPLEASRRVAESETGSMALSFGVLQALSLILGCYVLFGWIFDFSVSAYTGNVYFRTIDRGLDFLGLPLFLYGVATLLASKRQRIQRAMAPIVKPIGGRLGPFAMRHISVKPHRAMAFLLIVALMTGVSLYPTITSPSFSERAERGAKVQLGTDWQLLYNAPDLADIDTLKGAAGPQMQALQPEINKLMESIKKVQGVRSVTWMYESVLPSFYLPGYGLKGVPLYLLGKSDAYMQDVYHEPQVGMSSDFKSILDRVKQGGTASSLPVTTFWRLSEGTEVLLGMDSRTPRAGAALGWHARIPAGDSAAVGHGSPGIRPGARRLPESPFQQQCLPRRRCGQSRDWPAATAHPAHHHAGQYRWHRRGGRVRSNAGARVDPSAAGDPRSRARDREGRHRHVHRAGPGEHAHLPDRRPGAGAHRHPGDCHGQPRRGSADARAAAHPWRIAARSLAVRRRHAAVAGDARPGARVRSPQCWRATGWPTTSGSFARFGRSCNSCRRTSCFRRSPAAC